MASKLRFPFYLITLKQKINGHMAIPFRYQFLLVLFFTLLHFESFTQTKVDEIISKYPANFSSYEELADKIKTDFNTDEDKVRAAFAWIAMNVEYKTKGVNKTQKIRFSYTSDEDLQTQKDQFRRDLALETIKSRKALCEGYATLFQEICNLLNIECVIIPGAAKRFVSEIGNNKLPSNHAWNAVKINGKWKLADITWAAGSVDYAKMEFLKEYTPAYFDNDPKEFAMKHYPDNQEWLLLNKEFTREEFALQPTIFNEFIGKGYQIINPENGLISIRRGNEIAFSIANVPSGIPIAYHFKSEKFGQLVKPILKKNIVNFSVPTNKKGDDELIIYFENQPVLGYKVSIK
ncbi:transglutaminase domain-containing protein [Labilibaculum euxinus]